MDIAFIHPDLGIGGAERLVIDATVGLQERGHKVTIYTSRCDKSHCFDEAKDGTLKVKVLGNTIVPTHIFGRFSILCAILRQLHLSLKLLLTRPTLPHDILIVDQLSASIPLLRLKYPILFYCHFPDKYLARGRESWIKEAYRLPFDWVEEVTTGMADAIVVNSLFTKSVFKEAFPGIEQTPDVIYPSVDIHAPSESIPLDNPLIQFLEKRKIILSINRFEMKKNIELALESFASIPEKVRTTNNAVLVIAGGHDPRNAENIAYSARLQSLASTLHLSNRTIAPPFTASPRHAVDVLFLHNINAWLKSYLLSTAQVLVYTPANEHFGIVPLEAQLHSTPVLAVPSGGPLETIEDNVTGFLRQPSQWTEVLERVLLEGVGAEIGQRGRERVLAEFSKEAMAARFEVECVDVVERTGGIGQGAWVLKWDLWVGWAVVGALLGMIWLQLSR